MPKRCSAEFGRRVLDLVAEGRKVVEVAQDLGLGSQTVYSWRRHAAIDAGERPGLRTEEAAELAAVTTRRFLAERRGWSPLRRGRSGRRQQFGEVVGDGHGLAEADRGSAGVALRVATAR